MSVPSASDFAKAIDGLRIPIASSALRTQLALSAHLQNVHIIYRYRWWVELDAHIIISMFFDLTLPTKFVENSAHLIKVIAYVL